MYISGIHTSSLQNEKVKSPKKTVQPGKKVCLTKTVDPKEFPEPDQNVITDLTTPNKHIRLETMNYFINFVNEKSNFFNMINITVNNNNSELYKPYTRNDRDDMQIMYGDQVGIDKIVNYITVYYSVSLNVVRIFDSFFRSELSKQQLEIIKIRYPNQRHNIDYQKPRTWHIDASSNGPLAMAYATLCVFSENIAAFPLELDVTNADPTIEIKKHILHMFESKKIIRPEKPKSIDLLNPQISKELASSNEPFSDVTVNYFIQLGRFTSKYKYDTISLANYNSPYKSAHPDKPDVQILYGDNSSNPHGYYICIFYDGKKSKKSVRLRYCNG